jgi:hypothetical protein
MTTAPDCVTTGPRRAQSPAVHTVPLRHCAYWGLLGAVPAYRPPCLFLFTAPLRHTAPRQAVGAVEPVISDGLNSGGGPRLIRDQSPPAQVPHAVDTADGNAVGQGLLIPTPGGRGGRNSWQTPPGNRNSPLTRIRVFPKRTFFVRR